VLDNSLFVGILVVTSFLQVLIVEFGSVAFHVAKGGLEAKYWGISLLLGALSLPVQQVINVIYNIGQRYRLYRNMKRKKKSAKLISERINGGDHQHHHHPE
jgi:hypothetical protein